MFILGLALAATLVAVVAIPLSVIRYYVANPASAPVDIGVACGVGLASIALVFKSVGAILQGIARIVAARNAAMPFPARPRPAGQRSADTPRGRRGGVPRRVARVAAGRTRR